MIQADLIIWDEAPMANKLAFEALDRTLRDIIGYHRPEKLDHPFGGKTVLLGGDFRQILHLGSDRADHNHPWKLKSFSFRNNGAGLFPRDRPRRHHLFNRLL